MHSGLHVADDSVVLELMPTEEANTFRIIVTNLTSWAMPFIRYDTGDLGGPSPSGVCTCGSLCGA